MKKLMLISLLILVVMYPAIVLAGNVYLNANGVFYNESNKLPKAKGTANIIYNNDSNEWTVTIDFSGLLKNQSYIFQFGLQGELVTNYDYSFTSDRTGKFKNTFVIDDLDGIFTEETFDELGYGEGYTILRLIDLSGKSGGMVLKDFEPTCETNPYCAYPKATMVMRAREDGYRGSLIFY